VVRAETLAGAVLPEYGFRVRRECGAPQ
jgi:hypothetical protein